LYVPGSTFNNKLYADVTLTTSSSAAANINQGSGNNIIYVTQMSVTSEAVVVNNIQFTLNGTLDANDLTTVSIYFNANTPTISGSTLLNSTSGAFTSGHAYAIPFSNSMAPGSTGYYIIAVNVDPAATDNHTIKIDGAANPVVFGFTTTPNIINNQSDGAGAHIRPQGMYIPVCRDYYGVPGFPDKPGGIMVTLAYCNLYLRPGKIFQSSTLIH
jgi:hypothetical protein